MSDMFYCRCNIFYFLVVVVLRFLVYALPSISVSDLEIGICLGYYNQLLVKKQINTIIKLLLILQRVL